MTLSYVTNIIICIFSRDSFSFKYGLLPFLIYFLPFSITVWTSFQEGEKEIAQNKDLVRALSMKKKREREQRAGDYISPERKEKLWESFLIK